jgi:hypothetical protein
MSVRPQLHGSAPGGVRNRSFGGTIEHTGRVDSDNVWVGTKPWSMMAVVSDTTGEQVT